MRRQPWSRSSFWARNVALTILLAGALTALAPAVGPATATPGKPLPSILMSGVQGRLDLVSCPTAAFCMAVGWTGTKTIIDTERNGVWHTSLASLGEPSGLACASPVDCIEIGHLGIGVSQFNGKSWHIVLALANSKFLGVGCQTSVLCTLVTAQALYVMNGPVPTVVQVTGVGQNQSEFACASGELCLGVSSAGDNPELPDAAVFGNGQWATSSIQSTNLDNHVTGVACTGPAQCVVVGLAYDDLTSDGVMIERLTGTTWSIPKVSNPGADGGPFDALTLVSCSALARLCTAMGNGGDSSVALPNFSFIEMASSPYVSWSSALLPAGGTYPSASCSATNVCVAVGSRTVSGSQVTSLETWDGSAWSKH